MDIDYRGLAAPTPEQEAHLPLATTRIGRSRAMKLLGVGVFAWAMRLFVPKQAWAGCTHSGWAGPCDCYWCCHCSEGSCYCSACSAAWTCGSNHCWYVNYNGGTYHCCDYWEGQSLCCCRHRVA